MRIVRPYSSRDEYLQGDAWTVERSEMLLIGVEGVAPGASVNFEIALENREIVVRGEGRALEFVPPRDGKPSGVRVRFKQLDAESKATLRKALEHLRKQRQAAALAAADAAEPARPPAPSAPELEARPVKEEAVAGAEAAASAPAIVAAPAATDAGARVQPEREEPSGVHHRLAGPIRAPENRDALLERLRERMRLRKGAEAPPKSTAAAE